MTPSPQFEWTILGRALALPIGMADAHNNAIMHHVARSNPALRSLARGWKDRPREDGAGWEEFPAIHFRSVLHKAIGRCFSKRVPITHATRFVKLMLEM